MVRHIVTWSFGDNFSAEGSAASAKKIKTELEALKECIDGIVELNVYINVLCSCDRDLVLNSLFVSEEALQAYQIHPEHKRVSAFVRSVTQNRVCIDYVE